MPDEAKQQPEPTADNQPPDAVRDTPKPADQTETKTPPDPEKIKALLQMAEMQSMGGTASRKPYKAVVIVLILTVLVCAGSYIAVMWAGHHK